MRKKPPTRLKGKRSKEVADKTKRRILIAALDVFAKEGFPDAKLRVIAVKAGTTHNLIRHHFGSKDDLWKAVVDDGLRMREAHLKQIIESGQSMDPVVLFKKLIRSHVIFASKNAELAKILMHSNSRTSPHLDYIIEKQKGIHNLVTPFFEKSKAAGYFKDFDHDSFTVYMRALAETPIATTDLTNRLLKHDIRSKKGISLHTQRVIDFLFRKDE
ncbi:TetR/AcrR family transcriptional regulator [Thermodesulfobacteriota bacterium]